MLRTILGVGLLPFVLAAADSPAAAPSCSLLPGWSQHGAARGYAADNLFEYMDGNAEGYLLYGFQHMSGVSCTKGDITLIIDVSDFGDPDSAYGMFTANRDLRHPSAKIGMGGQIVPSRFIFAKDRYYVEATTNQEGDHTPILTEWAAALEKTVPGSSAPPAAIAWFPVENQQSLRLVPESVLGIRVLKRGYAAQYDLGKAFVVTEASPGSASALLAKLRARYPGAAPATAGGEAFQADDQYLGRLCFFRKGRYVGGYANVLEGHDPVALAAALAGRLP